MEFFFKKMHTDLVGFSASMVCAVHCGMLPFILTFSSLSGLQWMSEPAIEITFIVLSALIATFALGRNFSKHKHIMLAIKVIAVGFALIIIGRFFHGSNLEHGLTAAGGITIAIGHILNWRLANRSACCKTH